MYERFKSRRVSCFFIVFILASFIRLVLSVYGFFACLIRFFCYKIPPMEFCVPDNITEFFFYFNINKKYNLQYKRYSQKSQYSQANFNSKGETSPLQQFMFSMHSVYSLTSFLCQSSDMQKIDYHQTESIIDYNFTYTHKLKHLKLLIQSISLNMDF